MAALAAPDAAQTATTTFASAFNSTLGDVGTGMPTDNALSALLAQFNAASAGPALPPRPAPTATSAQLEGVFSILDWTPTNPAVEASPAVETTPSPLASFAMKRKLSDVEAEDSSSKRARSSTPVAKRAYRRQAPKTSPTLQQLAAAASSGSPLVPEKFELIDTVKKEEPETVAAVRLTSTGKPSTARPKAVVPEKYMKNGEAQAVTGMTTEQILAYPNWEALMQDVDEAHRPNAEILGKMITDNRDKAKWAAKKSRDERKQKVEQLEGQVEELQKKITDMRNIMLKLARTGEVSYSVFEGHI
jgi:hypothetical protein